MKKEEFVRRAREAALKQIAEYYATPQQLAEHIAESILEEIRRIGRQILKDRFGVDDSFGRKTLRSDSPICEYVDSRVDAALPEIFASLAPLPDLTPTERRAVLSRYREARIEKLKELAQVKGHKDAEAFVTGLCGPLAEDEDA